MATVQSTLYNMSIRRERDFENGMIVGGRQEVPLHVFVFSFFVLFVLF